MMDLLTSNIRIGSCLQRTKAVANDEDCCTEASERSMKDTRPCYEGSYAIQAEPPDEDAFVTVVSKKIIRMAERSQRISSGLTVSLINDDTQNPK